MLSDIHKATSCYYVGFSSSPLLLLISLEVNTMKNAACLITEKVQIPSSWRMSHVRKLERRALPLTVIKHWHRRLLPKFSHEQHYRKAPFLTIFKHHLDHITTSSSCITCCTAWPHYYVILRYHSITWCLVAVIKKTETTQVLNTVVKSSIEMSINKCIDMPIGIGTLKFSISSQMCSDGSYKCGAANKSDGKINFDLNRK